MQEELDVEELGGGFPAGAIVGIAVAAGIAAFLISRAKRPPEAPPPPPPEPEGDLRERTVSAAREFVAGRLLPELKPVLLELVAEVKAITDMAFQRLEKAIAAL